MNRIAKLAICLAAPALFAFFAGAAAATGEGRFDCIGDWSEAAMVVEREDLARIGAVARTSHTSGYGGLLSTTLCKAPAGRDRWSYVYLVVVREKSGRLKRIVLDAKTLRLHGS